MKLNAEEMNDARSLGLYITEKCDGCGKLLNQSVRYTITGKREAYCSAKCRDAVFFDNRFERGKRANPGRCANCGGPLEREIPPFFWAYLFRHMSSQ